MACTPSAASDPAPVSAAFAAVGWAGWQETRCSCVQSLLVSKFAQQLRFAPAPGPSPVQRFPEAGLDALITGEGPVGDVAPLHASRSRRASQPHEQA